MIVTASKGLVEKRMALPPRQGMAVGIRHLQPSLGPRGIFEQSATANRQMRLYPSYDPPRRCK
jgi:hypothetical protein